MIKDPEARAVIQCAAGLYYATLRLDVGSKERADNVRELAWLLARLARVGNSADLFAKVAESNCSPELVVEVRGALVRGLDQ